MGDSSEYVQKLQRLVQLTGYSDPVYAESFVNFHKFDIQFEILLVNRTQKPIQHISVEFFTQGDQRIVENAPILTLQPNACTTLKTSMKFSSQDIGYIFGYINYENLAGIEQANLITKEITIDLIDFTYPVNIDLNQYRKMWAKYEWENRIVLNTNINNLYELVKHIEKQFKVKLIGNEKVIENSTCICANFYAKTKLDDDFLINVSAEIVEEKIQGYAKIRAKNKGIVINLGEKLKILQNKLN